MSLKVQIAQRAIVIDSKYVQLDIMVFYYQKEQFQW